jgi:outer membrane protein OmpA-like peptidoglycan-associated protein
MRCSSRAGYKYGHRLVRGSLAGIGLCFGLVASARQAEAQEFRLHAVGGIGHAVGGFQQSELTWGGTARGALELVLVREFGVYAQGSGTWLGAGALPQDPTLAPLDAASSYEVLFGVHVRPFARHTYGRWLSPAGLWFGGAGGFAFTGGNRRYAADAGLGLDLLFANARFGIGPMLGYEHVWQPNSELRPDDANVLFAGVHGMFEIGLKPFEVDGDIDEDGIIDSKDKCPTIPEDKDGFEDEDGCPDKDNDNDNIVDVYDKCPNVAEDKDGFQDEDGCPDLDNDKDGIPDAVDQCPNDAEDKDGFEDEDGCPDKDNDKDGIPDKEDLCPNEPETVNGYADEDGCPDAEQIRVLGDKIVLDDRVHFMVNAHIIRGISYPLLGRLAKLINEHPEYTHIDIQGHTDERGPDWFNDKLSQDRANAVLEFLVSHGVKRDRLSAHGYGKSKPLVERTSEYAWYMNRRVEFELTRDKKQTTIISNLPATAGGKIESQPVDKPQTPDELQDGRVLNKPIKDAAMPPPDGAKKEKGKKPSKKAKPSPKPSSADEDPESKALPMNEEHPESEGAQ